MTVNSSAEGAAQEECGKLSHRNFSQLLPSPLATVHSPLWATPGRASEGALPDFVPFVTVPLLLRVGVEQLDHDSQGILAVEVYVSAVV